MIISKLDYMAKKTYIRENMSLLINLIRKDFPNATINDNGNYSLSIESTSSINNTNNIIRNAIKTMVNGTDEESNVLFSTNKITDSHIIVNI